MVNLLAARLKSLFGHRVQLEFVNITLDEEQRRFLPVWERVRQGQLLLPVTMVGDNVVAAGIIELDPVISALEKLGILQKDNK